MGCPVLSGTVTGYPALSWAVQRRIGQPFIVTGCLELFCAVILARAALLFPAIFAIINVVV
jgi:hypothetical protein